jgi:hypothetical protein
MPRFGDSSALGCLLPSSSDGRSTGPGDWTLNRANRSSTALQIHLRPFRTTLLYRVVDSDDASAFVSSHSRHGYLSPASTRHRRRGHELSDVIDDKPLHDEPLRWGPHRAVHGNPRDSRRLYMFYKWLLTRQHGLCRASPTTLVHAAQTLFRSGITREPPIARGFIASSGRSTTAAGASSESE